jgi:SAM-dependent methyltransferase
LPPGPYSRLPWLVKTCPACGFTYLENPPAYAALEEDFAWEKTSAAEEARRRAERPRGKRLSQAFRHFRQKVLKRDKLFTLLYRHVPRGRVLDIGCGGGGVLARLPADRYEPQGIEISRVLAAQADALVRPRGGQVVQANAVEGLAAFASDSLDGALLSAFLEHEAQPALLLRGLHRALRPGAPVIIKVPNYASLNRRVRGAQWCGFRFPDHVNYFTPNTLAQFAKAGNFRVRQCNWGDRWPLSDNLWMVVTKVG